MPPVFGPGVAVAEALVVAGQRQRERVAAVAQGDEARLAAVEPLLDDDPCAPGVASSARRWPRGPRRRSSQTVTPLPAASPSALTTSPRPSASSARANGSPPDRSAASNAAARAIRTPAAAATSWQNALLVSIRAAAASGPKTAIPAARSASATPAASGASGPTTTSSAAIARASATTAAPSSGSTSPSAADPRLGRDRVAARARR